MTLAQVTYDAWKAMERKAGPVSIICGHPMPLEECKTDEQGKAVHQECYALRIGWKPNHRASGLVRILVLNPDRFTYEETQTRLSRHWGHLNGESETLQAFDEMQNLFSFVA